MDAQHEVASAWVATSAGLYLVLNIGAGLALGFLIGWGTKEAFIIAGATGISSSAIVTKLLVELQRLKNPETSLILGIIVLEDLFLALYLAALAPVLGTAAGAGEAVLLFLRALGFLIALALVARYGRAVVGRVISAPDDELLVVLFVGFALLANAAHSTSLAYLAAVGVSGPTAQAAFFLLLVGFATKAGLVPFLGSLRVITRTGGLARSFPFKTTQLRMAAMVVPAALALVWGVLATPAFIGIAQTGVDRSIGDGFIAALVTAVAGLLGAVRWVTAKKVDFGTPMMATESGAMPPTLIFNLFRGFDMVALITAPLILQAGAYWSLAIAAVVFIALRGSFNMEEMKAEQEAQQKLLATAKAEKLEKQKIPRPTR